MNASDEESLLSLEATLKVSEQCRKMKEPSSEIVVQIFPPVYHTHSVQYTHKAHPVVRYKSSPDIRSPTDVYA